MVQTIAVTYLTFSKGVEAKLGGLAGMLILNEFSTHLYNMLYVKLQHDNPEFLNNASSTLSHSNKSSKIAYIYIKFFILVVLVLNYGTLVMY